MEPAIRQLVLERDGVRCQACGKEPAGQVHHIHPRRQGGSDSLSNLITLCGRCHMIISPVPTHALWNAFRIRKEDIPREKTRIENAIRRFVAQSAVTNGG